MKMIQLRNVPDALHRRLKARAALEGKSLSDYLLHQVQAVADRPTVEELRERLLARDRPKLSISPTEVLRSERDAR
jgi:plasmid stability protein